jgi:carbonic anhydrase
MKIIEITYRYGGNDVAVRPRPGDAEAARSRLDEGSRTMAALFENLVEDSGTLRRVIPVDPGDLGLAPGASGAPMQRPYAAILGCSDARVPIELIFNEGPNDLFVVRVAGNGLGAEVLGSLKYAVDHLAGSMKLIVVLGHSGCGAVSAAVDIFLNPAAYHSFAEKHSLRSILDRLLVVVHAAAKRMVAVLGPEVTHRRGYRQALVEAAIVSNAALAAYTVQQDLGSADALELRAAYGVYLLASRQIWAPRSGAADCAGLAYPPSDAAAFADFADAVVRSDRIAALLPDWSGDYARRPGPSLFVTGCLQPIPLKNSICATSESAWPRSDLIERALLNATDSGPPNSFSKAPRSSCSTESARRSHRAISQ